MMEVIFGHSLIPKTNTVLSRKKARTKGNGNWHARSECTMYYEYKEYTYLTLTKKGVDLNCQLRTKMGTL